ncbi:MAG: type II toxin-antitoxin system HicB family antitoxin [Egibacteraceae bacterium]
MSRRTAHAEWDPTGWWVVTVPDVPGAITQVKRLDQVRAEIAEAIEIQTGEAPAPEQIDVRWDVPGEAGIAAERARKLRAEAERMSAEAGRSTREAVRTLHRAGFSLRDIGAMTGISYQRAQQITSAKP